MLLHDDIVTNGEPESGSFSGGLGREEGAEHLSLISGGIPVPLSRILICHPVAKAASPVGHPPGRRHR